MSRVSVAGRALLAAVLLSVAAPAAAAPAAPGGQLTASSQRPEVATAVGRHFDYQARIINTGKASTGQLLMHLNIASLTSDVYVDPEDWSTDRSRFLAPLAAGAATTLSWDIQAVSPGTFDVYAVVLPARAESGTQLAVSSPTRVIVTARRTLNAGGALPVVVAVPVLLGVATLTARARGRTRRRA
jgi:hypothetical protein